MGGYVLFQVLIHAILVKQALLVDGLRFNKYIETNERDKNLSE